MKPRLILLSDLWGVEKSKWIHSYIEVLSPFFEIKIYDCCCLGEINNLDKKEYVIHEEFINTGITIASEKLVKLETKKVSILAFSIGGTIAWKAASKGLWIDKLYAVSSTRLRYEIKRPNCNIILHYGDKDQYRPDTNWFEMFAIEEKIWQNKNHQMYSDVDFIYQISKEIIRAQIRH